MDARDLQQIRLEQQIARRTRRGWEAALGGRSSLPSPSRPNRTAGGVAQPAISVGSIPAARLLVLSASGASVASGGDVVTFDTIVTRRDFPDAGGDDWTHPVTGVYVLDYEHAWDTYDEAGTIELELDGVARPEGMIGSGASGTEGRGTIIYYAEGGSIGKIRVTQTSGSDQTFDATLRLGITDPALGSVADSDEWTLEFAADVYDLTFDGTNWWTTNAGVTVAERDASGAVVSSFSVAGELIIGRGITFDGTDLWVAGDSSPDELLVRYSTAGADLTVIATGSGLDGNHGAAWDGSHVWLMEDLADEAQRFTTAGVEVSSFSVVDGCRGCAWFASRLYVVDSPNSLLLIFDAAGVAAGSIDLSTAVANPTGVWIAPDGTLYISKDGDGVYRRNVPVDA